MEEEKAFEEEEMGRPDGGKDDLQKQESFDLLPAKSTDEIDRRLLVNNKL